MTLERVWRMNVTNLFVIYLTKQRLSLRIFMLNCLQELEHDHYSRTLLEDYKTKDNFTPLQEFLEQTFCCFVEMSSVFKKDPKQENARPEDPDIKTELLFEVYDSLDSLVCITVH